MEIQIRDPVHSFISLRGKEMELLGTHPLQRLRGIKQLALASLVYPGAVHTRFDHTLGVVHVAGKMAESLGLQDDDIQLVRYAALLHDIGHGPFSHVSEYALERYADRNSLHLNQKKEKIHELVTARMIQSNHQILRILGASDCGKVVSLLSSGFGDAINRSVVSGPLDADKQDYLLRDSYFCGVKYGVFDLHQLHRSLVPRDGYLMLDSDGIHAVEQYVLAKYYLTTNVYRHKVRLISDQMIVRAIVLGIEKDQIPELVRLYSFDNSDKFAESYSMWDDARFLSVLGRSAEYSQSFCHALLRRLEERRLLKRVFQAKPKDFTREVREAFQSIGKVEFASRRSEMESAIAGKMSEITGQVIASEFVILHTFDIKSVKETSRNDEASILVNKSPKPVSFEDESSLFSSINEGLKEEFVEVYAPMDWNTRTDRDRLLDKVREPILEIIEEHCKDIRGG